MTSNPEHDLASVIDHFLPILNKNKKFPGHILRTLDALQKCRTPYMGGHIEACNDCGVLRVAYNSCRNRHCPKCGAIEKEKWIMAREADLLPVKYFHVVFTVPDKLNELFMNNPNEMYNLLFRVVWSVLKDFGYDKKWIGGKIGATAILHTWGQNLRYHPHIHLIIPAGALMPNNKWKHSRSRGKYLFTTDLLSEVYRSRFLEQIRELLKSRLINGEIPGGLFANDWVVYAKQPFKNPKQVIKYLSRYTHRTAISNDRILKVDDKKVTFTWKDYKNNYKKQISTIAGEEFLRLFCMHILPPGFTRIRHYGFLSNATKKKSLAIIRANLKAKPLETKTECTWQDIVFQRMGIKPGTCKCCGGKMIIVETMPNQFRQRAPPNPKAGIME